MSAYLDNELPAGEKLAVEGHLASCTDCSRELAELKRVQAVFRKHAMAPVPAILKETVFAEKPAAPLFAGWLKPALALSAAAAALLVVFGVHEYRGRGEVYSPAFSSMGESGFGSKADNSVSGSVAAPAAVSSLDGSAMDRGSRPAGGGGYGQAKFSGRVMAAREGSASAAGAMRGMASPSPMAGASLAKAEPRSAPGAIAARPDWLEKYIRECQAGQPGNPAYSVWRYVYKGEKVYYFPPQCCDQYSRLYDEAGKLLCAPDGGMTGSGDGGCADFFKMRTGGVQIWRDPR